MHAPGSPAVKRLITTICLPQRHAKVAPTDPPPEEERCGLDPAPCPYTFTGLSAQMSRAYSRIVRSLENLPIRAVLRIAMRAQAAWFR